MTENVPVELQSVDLEKSIQQNLKKQPGELAKLARSSIDAAEKHGRLMIDEYLRAGRYLHALKRKLGHTRWLPYLTGENIQERKAQRLMQMAAHDTAVLEYARTAEDPSFRGAIEAAQAQRRKDAGESVHDLESDTLDDEDSERAGKAKNVTPKSKRGAHERLMQRAMALVAELRAGMLEGEAIGGAVGYLLVELREIDYQLRKAIEMPEGDE